MPTIGSRAALKSIIITILYMSARTFILCLVAAAAVSVPAHAQNTSDSVAAPAIVSELASGTVEVILPDGFMRRLVQVHEADAVETAASAAESTKRKAASRNGYRVQIFDDNNARTAKREAQARRSMVGGRFPEYRTYVSFNSPYWRVKIGDFRSRSEAEAALAEIRRAFPSLGSQLRVVRDRINP